MKPLLTNLVISLEPQELMVLITE